jgi:ribosomal protein L25 (general stress protein Ctc)
MATKAIQMQADPRAQLGSRANAKLRESGFIPGVVYGHKEAVVPVKLPKKSLSLHLA